MASTSTMTEWLTGLADAALAGVLENREFSLRGPRPRSVAELAQRLDEAHSVVATLRELPTPCVQLAEAIVALGSEPTVGELVAFADTDDPELVAAWLDVLIGCAIAWPTPRNTIGRASALDAIFPSPLGLGPPLDSLLETVALEPMRRILRTLGYRDMPTRVADVRQVLHGLLIDPEFVRAVVETAPNAVRTELMSWAGEGRSDVNDEFADEFRDDYGDDPYDEYGNDRFPSYDPASYQRRAMAGAWAVERGLVMQQGWSYGQHMPAEVSRALRGPDFRAPYTPVPPAVVTTQRDIAALDNGSAAAVSTFAELTMAVVDRLARTPLPALKSGGVGMRELAKLAKAIGSDERAVRLVLALCQSIGLLELDRTGQWTLAATARRWRALSPTERIASLLDAWWQLPYSPGEARDEDDKVIPALRARPCHGCLLARQILLRTIGALPAGCAVERDELARLALWHRPFVHVLAQDASAPFATIWAEASELGLVIDGCATQLGRAVAGEDPSAIRTILDAALPEANDTALFGADLTVVVTGSPTLAVSTLLDTAADRESRGAATVWRFTPGSIRRAMDEGYVSAGLELALTRIATGPLPQSLRYLIGDIGRQHGNLRVSDAASVIRSDDAALLQQVAADRSLRKFGLRLIGPTVLACDVDTTTALAALRKAGYLPMPDTLE